MPVFSRELALQVAFTFTDNIGKESGLALAFVKVCHFLHDNPKLLSWRSKKNLPNVYESEGLHKLADRYFKGYRRSDFPKQPGTITDEVVSAVMRVAYGYSLVSLVFRHLVYRYHFGVIQIGSRP